jgi:DNA-binding protein HU-beta
MFRWRPQRAGRLPCEFSIPVDHRWLRVFLSGLSIMNKAELVAAVHKYLGGSGSKAAAERAVDAVLAAVKRGLRSDKEVQLVGFGTFNLATRPARRGFNPHTRRPMQIRAMKTIRFRAGTDLRELG